MQRAMKNRAKKKRVTNGKLRMKNLRKNPSTRRPRKTACLAQGEQREMIN
jgi:hypothetical protein